MNFKKYEQSYNLFNPDTATLGKYIDSNGNEQTSSVTNPTQRLNHSDYIPVSSNSIYTFSSVKDSAIQQTVAFVWYTASKVLISRTTEVKPLGITNYSLTATSPNNAEYAIINYTTANDEVMLNTGSTALPYEPYGDTWHDIPHYIHNTSTDTITTLPADLYPNDTTATVGLKGNMSQTGTPTPQNPIQPSECGDRTGNLFPLDESKLHVGRIENDGTIDYEIGTLTVGTDSATYEANVAWRGFYTDFIQVNENENLTFSPNKSSIMAWFCNCYDENGGFLGKAAGQSAGSIKIFTLLAGTRKVRMSVTSSNTTYTILRPMLNLGSTALPYEPYGYKIPISSASTTTPVYLGEVESTRRIKKLVLDGTEDWKLWLSGQPDVERYYYKWGKVTPSDYGLICTHFPFHTSDGNYEHVRAGGSSREDFLVFISRTIAPTLADFTAWLAAQYAAGTPVCVWYVLAEPTTGIVNEPLRKIEDYADTVSGITIPTIAGANSFDVLTTLKPSEVTVNYHGWHTGAVHERDSGAWD